MKSLAEVRSTTGAYRWDDPRDRTVAVRAFWC